VRLPASTIENLAPGTILRLDVPANVKPEWRVGGQFIAPAEAIRQGAHRAARMDRNIEEANR